MPRRMVRYFKNNSFCARFQMRQQANLASNIQAVPHAPVVLDVVRAGSTSRSLARRV